MPLPFMPIAIASGIASLAKSAAGKSSGSRPETSPVYLRGQMYGNPEDDYRIPRESRNIFGDTNFTKYYTQKPAEAVKGTLGPSLPSSSGGDGGGGGGGSWLRQAFGAIGPRPNYNFTPPPWIVTEKERQARLREALSGIRGEREGFEDRFARASARGGVDPRSGIAHQFLGNLFRDSMAKEAGVRGDIFMKESDAEAQRAELIAGLLAQLESQKMSATSSYNALQNQAAAFPAEKAATLAEILRVMGFMNEEQTRNEEPL